MDLSKLPKMSNTQAARAAADPQPPADAAPGAPPPLPPAAPANAPLPVYGDAGVAFIGAGAQAWFSAIIGLVFILLGWQFAKFLFATLSGQAYVTNVTWTTPGREGQPVHYFDLQGFQALSDSAMFVFGVALLLEAALFTILNRRLAAKALLLKVALAFTVLATAYNLYAAARMIGVGFTPVFSLVVVAVGGYMAMSQWRLLQDLGRRSS